MFFMKKKLTFICIDANFAENNCVVMRVKSVLFLMILLSMFSCGKDEIKEKDSVVIDGFGLPAFKMIYVGAGSYKSSAGNEMAVGEYYIGETEVTQSLWKSVMNNNPSYFKEDNNPVENVSWNECQDFVEELNRITGKTFRLPYEYEWEFAALGGNKTLHYKYSGSNNVNSVAWYYYNSLSRTHEVRTKYSNELGIYDMSGNVFEWCLDDYYQNGVGTEKVLKGGSWNYPDENCKIYSRACNDCNSRNNFNGLRLLMEAEE
ncbi:MAG: formylglycine-generating enzyme family protein [Bacteroidales bacterium]|nr:formylglycine-generating enzyme family protein [Bacteroidales bacterium]